MKNIAIIRGNGNSNSKEFPKIQINKSFWFALTGEWKWTLTHGAVSCSGSITDFSNQFRQKINDVEIKGGGAGEGNKEYFVFVKFGNEMRLNVIRDGQVFYNQPH